MRRGAASAGAGLVAAALLTMLTALAACTGDDDPGAQPQPESTTTVATSSPDSPDQPTEPTDPSVDAPTQPLVVVSTLHRPRLRLSLEQAQALADGGDDAALDHVREQLGGRAHLYQGDGAVRAVARDESAIAVVPADEVRPIVQTAIVSHVDPLRSPRTYPLRTAAASPPGAVTTMRLVGDIMLGRGVAAVRPDDPGSALRPYARWLRAADLTVGNLESALSMDGRPRQGDDSFAAAPTVLPDLARTGFDLLTLANNHTGDYGLRALRQTLRRIDDSPIARVGAGRDAAEAWAPVVLRRHGLSFGFLAFNAIGETPRATAHRPGVAEIRMQPRLGPLDQGDLARMTEAIARLARQIDVVTVLPHWGEQYSHRAVPDQRRVARALVDAGADLVIGGHPHWVQGMASRGRSVIAYSLGNFVFDMDFSQQTMEGIALDVTFWGDRVMAVTPKPYVLDARFAPHRAMGTAAERILDDVWRSSFGPMRLGDRSPS
jgi:poly-gamma-glutamate synthesis protein (capsule biosynthesis protein)